MQNGTSSSKKITAGIIGCGQIAESNHMPVLSAMGCSISWIVEKNMQKAKQIGNFYNSQYFSGINIPLPPVDVILIATPYGARNEYYTYLKQNNLDSCIYVEKPIALTVQEHSMICGLRMEHMLGGGYNKRYTKSAITVEKLVNSKIFGELKSIIFEFGSYGVKTSGKYYSNLSMSGGGILFELGVHYLDIIQHICGAQDVDVISCSMHKESDIDIHTEAHFQLITPHKNIPVDFIVSNLKNYTNKCYICFNTGIEINFSLFTNDIYIGKENSEIIASVDLIHQQTIPHSPYQVMYSIWKDFIEMISTKQVNKSSLSSSLLTTKIVEELYQKGSR